MKTRVISKEGLYYPQFFDFDNGWMHFVRGYGEGVIGYYDVEDAITICKSSSSNVVWESE